MFLENRYSLFTAACSCQVLEDAFLACMYVDLKADVVVAPNVTSSSRGRTRALAGCQPAEQRMHTVYSKMLTA